MSVTRVTYAHDAEILVGAGGDSAAPGGAITVALCGHWNHQPPCPRAPHHTGVVSAGADTVRLRVLFAAEPADEPGIRSLIVEALKVGRATGPNGQVTTWTLRSSTAGDVRPDEKEHAARLRDAPSGDGRLAQRPLDE